jgi:uncharacterized membrane protein YphA (DoxX/SURF4 family)
LRLGRTIAYALNPTDRMNGRTVATLRRWWPWPGLVARLIVGGVWIVAGWLKLPDPAGSVRAVRAYQLLPEAVVPTVGYALPVVEIAVGVLLVVGLGTRVAAAVSAVMQVAFIIGISAAWARGIQIECGCFGGGGATATDATAKYPWDIARDVALALTSMAIALWPRTRLRLEMVLFSHTYDDAVHEDTGDIDTDELTEEIRG